MRVALPVLHGNQENKGKIPLGQTEGSLSLFLFCTKSNAAVLSSSEALARLGGLQRASYKLDFSSRNGKKSAVGMSQNEARVITR